jgi:hypothetical protein
MLGAHVGGHGLQMFTVDCREQPHQETLGLEIRHYFVLKSIIL